MIIIGLSGKIGVGKNYVASKIRDMIKEQSLIVGFADHLKVEVARKYIGVDLSDCLVADKSKVLRTILQIEGTEKGRDVDGDDVWVKRLENWITLHNLQSGIEVFIIPDCRFRNEAEWIENRYGLLIKIEGPQRRADGKAYKPGEETKHISENSLNNYKFKYILNNNENNNLEEDIRKIFKSHYKKIESDINYFLLND